ncbi:hypothetical protein RO3G_04141 [Rhizopus delemar RA 99-880]|uniref:Uncharacterized protein n=1 Tax=Rhizopus delemar (strain RA 99-880 / ATCC MYA-4621 / FGSC 9543 / NRRL 43880) TaxID=246409 RepID=I1BTA6_RHIO9|nr:hypothetical protein RO3G_04141 [Rhizopus delemar RA 99-880]|eukprot:EIE79436.1 hypothetical protein RO3G_04141 [Rhizopus delemar RA 99-880]
MTEIYNLATGKAANIIRCLSVFKELYLDLLELAHDLKSAKKAQKKEAINTLMCGTSMVKDKSNDASSSIRLL